MKTKGYKIAFWTLWTLGVAIVSLIGGAFLTLSWILGG